MDAKPTRRGFFKAIAAVSIEPKLVQIMPAATYHAKLGPVAKDDVLCSYSDSMSASPSPECVDDEDVFEESWEAFKHLGGPDERNDL